MDAVGTELPPLAGDRVVGRAAADDRTAVADDALQPFDHGFLVAGSLVDPDQLGHLAGTAGLGERLVQCGFGRLRRIVAEREGRDAVIAVRVGDDQKADRARAPKLLFVHHAGAGRSAEPRSGREPAGKKLMKRLVVVVAAVERIDERGLRGLGWNLCFEIAEDCRRVSARRGDRSDHDHVCAPDFGREPKDLIRTND